MRQPDSVSKNPNIGDQLQLIKNSLWLENFNPLLALYALFMLFILFDSATLVTFYDDYVQKGLSSIYFWFCLSVAGGLLWLLFDTFLKVSANRLSIKQKQTVPVRTYGLKALIAGVSLLSFLIGLILLAYTKLTAPDATSNASFLVFGGGFMMLSGIGSLTFLYGNQALQPFRNLWQRVSITGYFDKKKYTVGDTILFQMRDRLTINDQRLYRVHLQYVHEYRQKAPKGQRGEPVRVIKYRQFSDLSGVELYKGIRLSTLKPEQLGLKGNQFSRYTPNYWEILVEEHGGAFWGRFFVNMKKK